MHLRLITAFIAIFVHLLDLYGQSIPTLSTHVIPKAEIEASINKDFSDIKRFLAIAFKAEGLQPGETYRFYSSSLEEPQKLIGQFTADKEGKLPAASEKYPDFFLINILQNFANGEPFLFALVPNNNPDKGLVTSIVPMPIEMKWEDGASFSILLKDKEGLFFTAKATGFRPKERLNFTSVSCSEKLQHPISMDANGCLTFGMAPAVIGYANGGYAKITIKRKGFEKQSVSYKHGNIAKLG
ncbi:MAG: hypothetical protein ACSNEK_10300 [Parachlamydiaceae bacterium]